MQIDSLSTNNIKHLGLIPDGARRWAIRNKIPLKTAYDMTMKRIASYIDIFFNCGILSLSIYLASRDNINQRNKKEVGSFIDAEYGLVKNALPPLIAKWSCKVSIAGASSGTIDLFRSAVKNISQVEEMNIPHSLYLLIGYDPMSELSYAFQKSSTGELHISNFWVPEYIDGIIRTAGEKRLSNFLPIQSGYAELYFISKLFLDTSDQDMLEAYHDLTNRQQRHGK